MAVVAGWLLHCELRKGSDAAMTHIAFRRDVTMSLLQLKQKLTRAKLEAQAAAAPSRCSETTDIAEESRLLDEDWIFRWAELPNSLLNEDSTSQEGNQPVSHLSAKDVLCMAIDAMETMKEDKVRPL
ncbi:hypothetical protein MRX96_046725 [Rhipicephalus microplus]